MTVRTRAEDTNFAGAFASAQSAGTQSLLIRTLAHLEKIGCWRALGSCAEANRQRLMERRDAEEIAAFEGFIRRWESAMVYERVHGEGSLRKTDHPDYVRMMAATTRSRAGRGGSG